MLTGGERWRQKQNFPPKITFWPTLSSVESECFCQFDQTSVDVLSRGGHFLGRPDLMQRIADRFVLNWIDLDEQRSNPRDTQWYVSPRCLHGSCVHDPTHSHFYPYWQYPESPQPKLQWLISFYRAFFPLFLALLWSSSIPIVSRQDFLYPTYHPPFPCREGATSWNTVAGSPFAQAVAVGSWEDLPETLNRLRREPDDVLAKLQVMRWRKFHHFYPLC